ncbi:MAG: hypothetical protein JSS09_02440 [Verrucomicrobia bacterium]|nr:hypothetical protein [Verrucomicrobiota bacterium]
MRTSFISTVRVKNKWQVVMQNLVDLTTTPIPNENYDDEHTAKIAGIILAKMQRLSFIEIPVDTTLEPEKNQLKRIS